MLDVPGDRVLQAVQGIPDRFGSGPQGGDALLMDRADDVEEQIFLRLDVVVQAALEHPEAISDVLQRRPVVALLEEDLRCHVDELDPSLLAGLSFAPGASRTPPCGLSHLARVPSTTRCPSVEIGRTYF